MLSNTLSSYQMEVRVKRYHGEQKLPPEPEMHILKWISKWQSLDPQHAEQEAHWVWSLEVEPTLPGRRQFPRAGREVLSDQDRSHSSTVNLFSPPALSWQLCGNNKSHTLLPQVFSIGGSLVCNVHLLLLPPRWGSERLCAECLDCQLKGPYIYSEAKTGSIKFGRLYEMSSSSPSFRLHVFFSI